LAGFPANHDQKAGCRLQGKNLFDGYYVKIFIFCLPFQRAFPLTISFGDKDDELEQNDSGGPMTLPRHSATATHTTASKDLEIARLEAQVRSNNFNSHHKEKSKN
jgi:hypothetical protein